MDAEEQIRQQLAKSLNHTQPTEEIETTENVEVEPLHNNLPLEAMQLRNDLMDHFMLTPGMRQNSEALDKIKSIGEWATANAPSADMADILAVINHQEAIMGSRFSADRLERLYRYVRINNQMRTLQQQEKALYG